NNADNIKVFTSYKTLEYELSLYNVNQDRTKFKDNFLVEFINQTHKDKIDKIVKFTSSFPHDKMKDNEVRKVAILLWKSLPSKAEFAQDFSISLIENKSTAKKTFIVPPYIISALAHLKQGL